MQVTPEQTSELLEIATTLSLGSRLLTDFVVSHPELSPMARSHVGVVHSSLGLARRQLELVCQDLELLDANATSHPHRD